MKIEKMCMIRTDAKGKITAVSYDHGNQFGKVKAILPRQIGNLKYQKIITSFRALKSYVSKSENAGRPVIAKVSHVRQITGWSASHFASSRKREFFHFGPWVGNTLPTRDHRLCVIGRDGALNYGFRGDNRFNNKIRTYAPGEVDGRVAVCKLVKNIRHVASCLCGKRRDEMPIIAPVELVKACTGWTDRKFAPVIDAA